MLVASDQLGAGGAWWPQSPEGQSHAKRAWVRWAAAVATRQDPTVEPRGKRKDRERLPEGGSMVVSEILVRRHELALVRVGGPRGDRSLRIPTAKHRLVMRSGRYLVAGRLHSNHGEDPLAAIRRREPMVPLTDASIMFRVGVDIVEEPAGTIVVNRDLVEWVREGELDARTFDLPA